MEQVFNLERVHSKLEPLHIQSDLTVKEMLERVLRLPAVASKRYLTNKVNTYEKFILVVIPFDYPLVKQISFVSNQITVSTLVGSAVQVYFTLSSLRDLVQI